MVQVVVNLSKRANKAVGIIKEIYGMHNKSETVNFIVEKFSAKFVEPALRGDYIKRTKKKQKKKT